MTDFRTVPGFEDVWRPPVRVHLIDAAPGLLSRDHGGSALRARLVRVVNRAPEVMVKVTGRTRDGAHLLAHLRYISRRGLLELEGPDGQLIVGRREIAELALDWSAAAQADRCRRANSPLSHSVVLSMPRGTSEVALRDAAKAFAQAVFTDKHDYVLALHTDTPRPHVHLAVCSQGQTGERLNPKKADLERWRQVFAQALRDRGVEAEATPRRARGQSLKPERTPLRKIRERHEAGLGPPARVRRSAYRHAAKAAFNGRDGIAPWEPRLVDRQRQLRALYLTQAKLMQVSGSREDRDLGFRLEAFVRAMPAPDTQTLAFAREVRSALARGRAVAEERDRSR